MFIFEAAHTFGLCILVFKVLPRFDFVRALLLMCTSSIVPSLFKLLLTKVGVGSGGWGQGQGVGCRSGVGVQVQGSGVGQGVGSRSEIGVQL